MSKVHWLALSVVGGIGGATARKLMERFGSIEAALAAPVGELAKVPRISEAMAEQLRGVSLAALAHELERLAALGIEAVTWDDESYPANLRQLPDAPPLLFVRGALSAADDAAVAIVGSRQASPTGVERAEALARELAALGITIVSGLALGIDAAAHRGALDAAGGRTLAVLGCGLCAIHPRQNRSLAEAIARRGALISELHANARPSGPHLMARDRIVSGLSRAVIVVEAAARGGSVDTGARAQRQGRLVFAVPGSPGCDALLAAGAEALEPGLANAEELARRIRGHRVGGGHQLQLW